MHYLAITAMLIAALPHPRSCYATLDTLDGVTVWHIRLTNEYGHAFVVTQNRNDLDQVFQTCKLWLKGKNDKR